ncbi:glyoxalase [Bacillus sp. FJAT-27225]|uniref:VOC family protein n=1 Tax=Bacillus sp. FJAT-27225 TaxID=1743144 RepID=UPI00080C2ADF|nr:VOC family protein [Bacillus sp. FJAT-27225]OCA89361.1 glyoxalase [Bacillus sp. FJAT-27225]
MKFHRYPNTFIGGVNLKVENLGRSLEFYKKIIGFEVLEESNRKAVLGAGQKPLVTLEQPEGVISKQQRRSGLYHYAILLPSRKDLGKVLRHFIEINQPIGAGDHLVSEALYLDDPDGNGIEIYSDRPSSGWAWNGTEVEMTTKQIDAEGILASGEGESWNGMPADTIIGHVHLHVANLQETKKFYGEGLGFELVSRFPQALFMSTGGYHHHLGLNTWNGVGAPAPEENSAGLKYFTLLMPEEQREKVIKNLGELGVPVDEEYMVKDPSGIAIKLDIVKP